MSTFKEGDLVELTEFYGPHKKGTRGTVMHIKSDGLLTVGKPNGSAFKAFSRRFKKVAEPQWSDVEPGDKVTTRHHKTGDEVVLTAFAASGSGSTMVLDSFTGHKGVQRIQGLELLSIEKPKPQPPTTPGSHVTVPFPWESGVNHLFLLDSGKWASQTGLAFWPTEDVASKDFTVIHDAGKAVSDG